MALFVGSPLKTRILLVFFAGVFHCLLIQNKVSAQGFYKHNTRTQHDDCWCFYTGNHCLPGDISLGLNLQLGNIRGIQLEVNFYATSKWLFYLSYQASQNHYISKYITAPCLDCDINFHTVGAGIAYEWNYCHDKYNSIFISPGLMVGAETVPNAVLFQEHDPTTIFGFLVKPRLQAGWQHKNLGFYLGINYSVWPLSALGSNFRPMYDVRTETPIKWGSGLFPTREGLGYIMGFRYFIRQN